MISKAPATSNGQPATVFIYDAENQLIQINLPNGDVANYKYDGLGRRIEKALVTSSTSQVTRFVYDNEDIAFEFDGSNTLTASYIHGPGIDEPLAMNRGGSDYFYHTDSLGTITDLTDSLGNITQSYLYDSFGQIVTQGSGLLNPFTFTGREYDSESGLYYYRARYYLSETGRFLQEDPIRIFRVNLGYSQYVYALGNPINWTDSFGLQVVPVSIPDPRLLPVLPLIWCITNPDLCSEAIHRGQDAVCSITDKISKGVAKNICVLNEIPYIIGERKICVYRCGDGSKYTQFIPANSTCDSVIIKIFKK